MERDTHRSTADTGPQGAPPPPFGDRPRYQPLWRIAGGGSGEVVCALQHGSMGFRRLVALKRLHPGGDGRDAVDALIREARLGGLLRHKNLAAVYDLDRDGDGWFLVMELVEGHTVRELIEIARRTAVRLPPRAAFEIVAESAAGLHHAHHLRDEAGELVSVIHCDVKPENLILSRDGVIKVIDLGVARVRRTAGIEGLPGYTLPYASPELVAGRLIDPRADVYALGAVLYELLALRPWPGENLPDRLSPRQPELLERLVDVEGIAPAVLELLRACLEPDPEARLSGADVLARRLRELGASPVALNEWRLELPPPATQETGGEGVGRAIGTITRPQGLAAGRDVVFVAAAGIGADDRRLGEAGDLEGERLDLDGEVPVAAFGEAAAALRWVRGLLSPPAVAVGVARLRLDPGGAGVAAWERGAAVAVMLAAGVAPGGALVATSPQAQDTPDGDWWAGDVSEGLGWEPLGRYRLPGQQTVLEVVEVWPASAPAVPAAVAPGSYAGGGRPFRGLASFEAGETGVFFGREDEVAELEALLLSHGLVSLMAPSGCGKSSLLAAGLLPRLTGRRCFWLRPEAAPLQRMRTWSGPEAPDPASDPEGWGAWVARSAADHGARALVVVDQAEELLTLCPDADARSRVARALVAAVDAGGQAILSVRADFFAELATTGALRGRAAGCVMVLSPPGDALLRTALVRPLERFGYTVDESVVGDVASALSGTPAGLALLQVCGAAMWELRDRARKHLPWQTYEAAGRVQGAISAHAEWVIRDLSDAQRAAVRRLMGGLIAADGTRRPMPFAQALRLAGIESGGATLLDRLVAGRLLVVTDDEDGARVEIAHEALFTHWKSLGEWRAADQARLRLLEHLQRAAQAWDERGRPSGLLWGEEMLAGIALQQEVDAPILDPLETGFVERSRRAAKARRWRAVSLLLSVVTVLTVGTIWALRERTSAQEAAREADAARLESQNSLATAKLRESLQRAAYERARGNVHLAIQIARDELLAHPGSEEAFAELLLSAGPRDELAILTAHSVSQAEFSADGSMILTDTADGVTRLWSRAGRPLREIDGRLSTFSPDGARIATATHDGRLRLWAADGALEAQLETGSKITRLAWRRDGSRLAVVWYDGQVGVTDRRGRMISRVAAHQGVVQRVAWKPDGSTFATLGYDAWVREWSPDGAPTGRAWPTMASAEDLHWTDDGSRLLISSWGNGERVLDVDSGRVEDVSCPTRFQTSGWRPHHADRAGCSPDDEREVVIRAPDGTIRHRLSAHTDVVRGVAWSPDGGRLATQGGSGQVAIWRADGSLVRHFQAHAKNVTLARWSPDGELLLTAGDEGTVKLWDGQGLPPRRIVCPAPTFNASWSPSGDRLFAGWSTQDERRWGAGIWRTQERDWRLLPIRARVTAQTWDPAGDRLATLDTAGRVELWSSGGARLAALEGGPFMRMELNPSGDRIAVIEQTGPSLYDGEGHRLVAASHPEARIPAWDPTGRRLVTADTGGRVTVWSADDLSKLRTLEGTDTRALRVCWRPQGDRLVIVRLSGRVEVWDPEGRRVADRQGHKDMAVDCAWSPDGSTFATAGWDRLVKLWDPDGLELARLEGHDSPVGRVSWSPDGTRLVTACWNTTALLWDRSGRRLAVLEAQRGELLYPVWRPDSKAIATFAQDRDVLIWPVTPASLLAEADRLLPRAGSSATLARSGEATAASRR